MHLLGSNVNCQESIDQAEVVPIEDLGECLDPRDRLEGVGRYKSCLLLSGMDRDGMAFSIRIFGCLAACLGQTSQLGSQEETAVFVCCWQLVGSGDSGSHQATKEPPL